MGGLAGLIHFAGDAPSRERVEQMGDSVAVRGPDGEGAFAEGRVAFAHRTRSLASRPIVQPVVTDDVVLMLDGWIYDHTVPGHFMGPAAPEPTDSQTLLAAWQRWGRRFVEHVEGDFAVAVWERKDERLHLFRDRFGIRPLFWTRKDGRFGFASTLPALLHLDWVEREPDPDRLAEYLSFQVVHAPRTLVRSVHQVEPGHWLTVDAKSLVTRRWWAIRYAPKGTARPRDSEIIDTLQENVARAVRRRVPKETEVGLYLSGGLGSTAIAAAARRLYLNLPTFTLSFADDPYPELPFAGRVARLLGLEHHELTVGSADVAAAFVPTVRALGHPIGNPTAILQGLLAREARQRVRVVLAGDGGPELFGGRMLDRFQQQLRTLKAGRMLPRATRKLLGRVLGPKGTALTTDPDRLALELGIGGANLFSEADRRAVLADAAWVRPGVRQDVLGLFHTNLDTDPINTALHGFLRSWLGEGALARADRTATAAGLDARFPLLDHEIVTYAAGLPGSVKVRRVGGSLHSRWPLRAMLDGVLPAPLVNRPRRGMPSPPDGWLANAGRLFFEERWELLREDPLGLFDAAGLEGMRARLASHPEVSLQFWALFVLDAWMRDLRP
ncbi:MAG: asparagine synthase (glutamine-hydrolyzing) [Alphaproteobacteria bacterium]|nr:asparagine synthase (glutamine-hydrolyzing) [Alphaproteobacteria bacterium]